MNYFVITAISAFTITLPFSVAVARFPRLPKRYLPLTILLVVGLLNECASFVIIMSGKSNTGNSAVYTLVEFLLYLWLFYRLQERPVKWFVITGLVATAVWLFDNLSTHRAWNNNTPFRVLSSFVIVWLSMDKVNQVLFNGVKEMYKKTDLLLCISFFLYYTYRTFIHIFNLFPVGVSRDFYTRLWVILSFMNMMTNIAYTIAILWIPKRQDYTLR